MLCVVVGRLLLSVALLLVVVLRFGLRCLFWMLVVCCPMLLYVVWCLLLVVVCYVVEKCRVVCSLLCVKPCALLLFVVVGCLLFV